MKTSIAMPSRQRYFANFLILWQSAQVQCPAGVASLQVLVASSSLSMSGGSFITVATWDLDVPCIMCSRGQWRSMPTARKHIAGWRVK
mmetsp:Transcript_47165/g.75022  ORF Transcript_47165/g.75022 Transcript_47165/m.75022 type:complete len:88 (+) Transcript_47165:261-524(+)